MPNYGDPKYWEERYKESHGKTFEWLEGFSELEEVFFDTLSKIDWIDQSKEDWRSKVKILNIGCGNSILPEQLYDIGFKNIVNNDISQEVIKQMKERNAELRPELQWEVMDVRDMSVIDDDTFDIIFDKSTIDAMLCHEEGSKNTAIMLRECQRVMKEGGYYLGISYGYPDNRICHYQRCHLLFDLEYLELPKNNPANTPHFVYIAKKREGAHAHCKKYWAKVDQEIFEEDKQMAISLGLKVK